MKQDDNILNKFGNKKPFSVPENYFENFAVEMEEHIAPKKEKIITVSFITKLKPYLYAAAMFALVLLVGDYLMNKHENKVEIATEQHELLMSYLDENTIIEFLIEHDNL